MDDAFMFYRYAMNIRHGLGISWNPDGVHTYGETAPLWGLVVLLLSYTKFTATHALLLGSWLCGGAAIAAMAWAVAHNAKSEFMRSTWRVLPMVGVPLLFTHTYWANALTGMETMLAAGLAAIFLGLAIGWTNGIFRPEWAACVGLLLFLTRPETALAVVVLGLIVGITEKCRRRETAVFLGIFLGGILLDLLCCRLYFHTALPLSFYMKSGHAYEGYHMEWHPLTHALGMLVDCSVFLGILFLFTHRAHLRLVALCVLPALVTFCYLCTVTQIMGWKSRYYVPYFAFFVIPALLVLDDRINMPRRRPGEFRPRSRALYLVTAAVGAVCISLAIGHRRVTAAMDAIDRRLEGRPFTYEQVHYGISATAPLPPMQSNIHEVGDVLLAPLPAGLSIAASEVGYIGVANLNATVIDLEGLNDTEIALHGFSVEALIARAPDIIWMPQTDYSYQRGLLLSSPLLLQHYDLFVGAAGYDIAIRKDSPMRSAILKQMQVFWKDFYAGYPMNDYLARSVSWSGRKYKPVEQ
jgi:hypothetical protein